MTKGQSCSGWKCPSSNFITLWASSQILWGKTFFVYLSRKAIKNLTFFSELQMHVIAIVIEENLSNIMQLPNHTWPINSLAIACVAVVFPAHFLLHFCGIEKLCFSLLLVNFMHPLLQLCIAQYTHENCVHNKCFFFIPLLIIICILNFIFIE